jgi:alkylhydroperoxidase family enzyme
VAGGVDAKTLEAVLADHRSAPIDERLRATLTFLEKLTLHPEQVGAEDVAPARAAGVTDEALEEAIRVCFLFCTIDRLADALDFKLPTERSLRWVGRILLKLGYAMASVPG